MTSYLGFHIWLQVTDINMMLRYHHSAFHEHSLATILLICSRLRFYQRGESAKALEKKNGNFFFSFSIVLVEYPQWHYTFTSATRKLLFSHSFSRYGIIFQFAKLAAWPIALHTGLSHFLHFCCDIQLTTTLYISLMLSLTPHFINISRNENILSKSSIVKLFPLGVNLLLKFPSPFNFTLPIELLFYCPIKYLNLIVPFKIIDLACYIKVSRVNNSSCVYRSN